MSEITQRSPSVEDVMLGMEALVQVTGDRLAGMVPGQTQELLQARRSAVEYWLGRLREAVDSSPDADAVDAARRVLAFIASWRESEVIALTGGSDARQRQLLYDDLLVLVNEVYQRTPSSR